MTEKLPGGGTKQPNVNYGVMGEKEAVSDSGPVLKFGKVVGKSGSVTTRSLTDTKTDFTPGA
jgi:hypothetical protein